MLEYGFMIREPCTHKGPSGGSLGQELRSRENACMIGALLPTAAQA